MVFVQIKRAFGVGKHFKKAPKLKEGKSVSVSRKLRNLVPSLGAGATEDDLTEEQVSGECSTSVT